MPIDPLSVATQGYIINDNPKQLIAITIATLGWIKPIISVPLPPPRKKRVGKSGAGRAAWTPRRRKEPVKDERYYYDIKIRATLSKLNKDFLDDQKEQVVSYREEHGPIKVDVMSLTHNNDYEVYLREMTSSLSDTKIKTKNIKLIPAKILVSGSLKNKVDRNKIVKGRIDLNETNKKDWNK